jgi:autotransporter-associated beta strand protein
VTDPQLRSFEVTVGRTATFEANAALAGAGSLTKTGAGELTLRGNNSHTGNWLISAGTVALADAGSLHDAAWINLNSGTLLDISQRTASAYTSDAVISGTGTLGGVGAAFTVGSAVGSISSTGVLKPGASSLINSAASAATVGDQTGTLTIQGDLILAPSAGPRVDRALLQVGATDRNAASTYISDAAIWVDAIPTDFASFMVGAGSNHDLVSASGTITLNASGGIRVALLDGYGGAFGDVFNLLDWSALSASYIDNAFTVGDRYRTGEEAGLDLYLPTLDAGLVWDTSLFSSYGAVVVVPEPGRSLLLLFAGLLTLLRRRRP